MVKKFTSYFKYMVIHLISFVLNYLIFILLMNYIKGDNVIFIQIINFIAWIISMLFIFFVDKLFVPDLVNEHNSNELYKFILVRILSLIIEVLILFIFVSVLQNNLVLVKLISLITLFIFNNFYVSHIKFN